MRTGACRAAIRQNGQPTATGGIIPFGKPFTASAPTPNARLDACHWAPSSPNPGGGAFFFIAASRKYLFYRQNEHIESASPRWADMEQTCRVGSFVQILLQNSAIGGARQD